MTSSSDTETRPVPRAERTALLEPYAPGEQPRDGRYIKLHANENPYPPSPRVAEAVCRALAENPMLPALYPDPDSSALRRAFAEMLNETGGSLCAKKDGAPFHVTPEMVFCGNGSDEVLSFVFYAFFGSESPLVTLAHTYSFYPVYSRFYGIALEKIPLAPDWKADLGAVAEAARELRSPAIFANPNAPTGTGVPRSEIRAFLERFPADRTVVIDEAYVDFGGETALPLLADFPNLVIVRTFSKGFSGAGMRLGFAVTSPESVRVLTTVKNSFNHFPVDALAQVAGEAACRDAAHYARNAAAIARRRDGFSAFLSRRGWTALPSLANFVFARKDGIGGRTAYEKIRGEGILVRHFAQDGIEDFVRVTIGTDAQMDALEKVMEKLSL
jgi:histidinol-phosphate aminotransferase